MGRFSNVNGADPSGQKLPYFLPGEYIVELDRCKAIDGRKGDVFFCIEATVQESTNEQREAGTKCSQLIKMNTDMGPINLKRFLAAVQGLDVDDEEAQNIGEDEAEEAIADDQPLSGLRMKLRCESTTTQKGSDFTIHIWSPLKENEAA